MGTKKKYTVVSKDVFIKNNDPRFYGLYIMRVLMKKESLQEYHPGMYGMVSFNPSKEDENKVFERVKKLLISKLRNAKPMLHGWMPREDYDRYKFERIKHEVFDIEGNKKVR